MPDRHKVVTWYQDLYCSSLVGNHRDYINDQWCGPSDHNDCTSVNSSWVILTIVLPWWGTTFSCHGHALNNRWDRNTMMSFLLKDQSICAVKAINESVLPMRARLIYTRLSGELSALSSTRLDIYIKIGSPPTKSTISNPQTTQYHNPKAGKRV
jgi:hypothetical protein